MKPEIILQANLLDLIFYNRNKAYGAYVLRSQYNKSLKKSLAITIGMVLLFSLSWYIKLNYFEDQNYVTFCPVGAVINLRQIELPNKQKDTNKAQKKLVKVNEVSNTTIRIVPDDSLDKKVPDIKQIDNAQVSVVNVTASGDTDYYPAQGGLGMDTSVAIVTNAVIENEIIKPFERAEIMPEFPGGNEALIKFMLRNLKEPEDMYEGEKVIVKVKFIVEENGEINHIEILNANGRYDNQVVSVIKKMPLWKPGMQNGLRVPVYLTLPVTFQKEE